MDRFDRDIVEFMLRWAPYGGPSEEDTMPEFGMNCPELRERAVGIIRDSLQESITLDDRILLLRTAAALRIRVIDPYPSKRPPPGPRETRCVG